MSVARSLASSILETRSCSQVSINEKGLGVRHEIGKQAGL
jgi:hypothetical protein